VKNLQVSKFANGSVLLLVIGWEFAGGLIKMLVVKLQ
jgi:hypothetical protein